MPQISRVAGTTSEILEIFIQNSASTTGAGITSLTSATSSLTAYYCRNDQTQAVVISLVAMTAGSFSSGGIVAIDNTNMPGWYQFCPPNGVFTSGRSAGIHLQGAANMAPLPILVELTATNNQDGVGGGMSRIDTTISSRMSGTTTPVVDIGSILGTHLTEGAGGRLTAGFKQFFDVASPTSTMNQITLVDTATRVTTAGTVSNVLTASIVSSVVALAAAYDPAKTAAQAGDAMTLTAAYTFAKGTSKVTESYAANTITPTPIEILLATHQMLMGFVIAGTTITVNKIDGVTAAFAVTLDSSTVPTTANRL